MSYIKRLLKFNEQFSIAEDINKDKDKDRPLTCNINRLVHTEVVARLESFRAIKPGLQKI